MIDAHARVRKLVKSLHVLPNTNWRIEAVKCYMSPEYQILLVTNHTFVTLHEITRFVRAFGTHVSCIKLSVGVLLTNVHCSTNSDSRFCDNNKVGINMDDNEIETYFLWLTEAEQSDLFDYEDSSLVSNLICEDVMEQRDSLVSDFDYVEKPLSEYQSNENVHVQNMNPESANVATTYNYNQEILPPNLFYNSSDMNHQYQTMNQNTAEFNPMFYGNPSKDVESIHQFNVQNSVMDSHGIVSSTMNYINPTDSSVIDYNNVPSLPNEMKHTPSNSIPDYEVMTAMQGSCVNVESSASSEQLHIPSALLDVPLEQLSNDAVTAQSELPSEPMDFGRVTEEVPMIPDDTNINFHHEPLDTIGSTSNVPSEFEPTTDDCDYHNDSSQSMVIDESSQLSINYDVEDQTVPENLDIPDTAYSEGESLSTCVTNEITIAESHESDANKVISSAVDENINRREEEEESSQTTETEMTNCENTNQVNGTLYGTENEIPVVQMCIRNGCGNSAVNNPEWEQEFCSNDCVVMHCRNVFDAWVAANTVMSQ